MTISRHQDGAENRLAFGQLLKRLRRARGFSGTELARRSFTYKSHICDLEQGKCAGGALRIQRLVKALGLSGHTQIMFELAALRAQSQSRLVLSKITLEFLDHELLLKSRGIIE